RTGDMPVRGDQMTVFFLMIRHYLVAVIDSSDPVAFISQQDHGAAGIGSSVLPQTKGNVGLEAAVMND
ncbi:hypothetical protein EBX31_11465, partial [bacterium]|nr:hypothetical protein [bacterium]